MRWTLTHVTALRIDAIAVLTRLRILAFVNIRAVASRFVQLESLVADAAEHAVNILAFTKDAQIAKHLTLVDVDARLLVAFVRVHESHFALAAERARIIEALTVLAKCRVVGAFVNVLADVTVAAETRVANALHTRWNHYGIINDKLMTQEDYIERLNKQAKIQASSLGVKALPIGKVFYNGMESLFYIEHEVNGLNT